MFSIVFSFSFQSNLNLIIFLFIKLFYFNKLRIYVHSHDKLFSKMPLFIFFFFSFFSKKTVDLYVDEINLDYPFFLQLFVNFFLVVGYIHNYFISNINVTFVTSCVLRVSDLILVLYPNLLLLNCSVEYFSFINYFPILFLNDFCWNQLRRCSITLALQSKKNTKCKKVSLSRFTSKL